MARDHHETTVDLQAVIRLNGLTCDSFDLKSSKASSAAIRAHMCPMPDTCAVTSILKNRRELDARSRNCARSRPAQDIGEEDFKHRGKSAQALKDLYAN